MNGEDFPAFVCNQNGEKIYRIEGIKTENINKIYISSLGEFLEEIRFGHLEQGFYFFSERYCLH